MTRWNPTTLRATAFALGAAATFLLGGDAWLAGKGAVARVLIAQATEATLAGRSAPAPWPWADFRPVARIEVPRLGVERPVLSGATGAVLAFGLGHVDGTARPGARGLSVVGGHRDGDARFLGALRVGDTVVVRSPGGSSSWVVAALRVVRVDAAVADRDAGDRLWLVTCWPIDAVGRGPLRYVVEAVPADASPKVPRSAEASAS